MSIRKQVGAGIGFIILLTVAGIIVRAVPWPAEGSPTDILGSLFAATSVLAMQVGFAMMEAALPAGVGFAPTLIDSSRDWSMAAMTIWLAGSALLAASWTDAELGKRLSRETDNSSEPPIRDFRGRQSRRG